VKNELNLNPIHDMNTSTSTVPQSNPAVSAPPPGAPHVFKLGLDVDLRFVVTATQCDHGAIQPAQKARIGAGDRDSTGHDMGSCALRAKRTKTEKPERKKTGSF